MAIRISEHTGALALDTRVARKIRLQEMDPGLAKAGTLEISFHEVEIVSLSFLHGLLFQTVKKHGRKVFRKLCFTHCNEAVGSCLSAWHHAYI